MENRAPSDRVTLSELRKEMEPFSLLSVREQEKTLHALFRRSVGEIPYERFKQLAYFGAPPETGLEEMYLREREAYMEGVFHPAIQPSGGGEPAAEALSRHLCLSAGADPIGYYRALNSFLSANSLPAMRHPFAKASWLPSAPEAIETIRNCPKTTKAFAEGLREVAPEEAASFLASACRGLPVRRAFLFGSFADGTSRLESDVDAAFEFATGLTEAEKLAAIAALRRAFEEGLGRRLDAHEALDCSEGALDRLIKTHVEVTIG